MPRPSWRGAPIAAFAAALLATSAAPLAVPLPATAATHQVQITDSAFATSVLTIQAGDTVTWVNADDRPHTATSDDGAFDSGNLDEGASFSFTFAEPGTYTYECAYHPDMRATIVVQAAAAPAAPAAPSATDAAPAGDQGADAGTAPAQGTAHRGDGTAAEDEQPDTAMAAEDRIPAISFLMWGLALICLGLAFTPPRRSGTPMAHLPPGGWRR